MTDFQLQKDKQGSLPFLSQWSRYETAQPTRDFGNTDHWSKMKHKSIDFEVQGNNGATHNFPGERLPYEKRGKRDLLTYRHDIDGSMRNIGVKSFSEWIIYELKGNVPGDYNKTRPTLPKVLRTSANDRAKDGFRYWYIEKKPSTYPYIWHPNRENCFLEDRVAGHGCANTTELASEVCLTCKFSKRLRPLLEGFLGDYVAVMVLPGPNAKIATQRLCFAIQQKNLEYLTPLNIERNIKDIYEPNSNSVDVFSLWQMQSLSS